MSAAVLVASRSARLVISRKEALEMLQTQLHKGEALQELRIRNVQELEKARKWKADWVQFTGAMLDQLFDSEELAQEFNRWVGQIIPEFSDLHKFVELYEEELEFRMGKLQEILDWVSTSAEEAESRLESPAVPVSAEAEPEAATQEPAAEPQPAPAPPSPRAVQPPPTTVAAPKPPRAPAAPQRCGALIIHASNQAVESSVAKFIGSLGYELICIGADGNGGTIEKLSQHPAISFAILLADDQDIAAARSAAGEPAPQATRRSAFELGFCTGKLGVERVCVLHASGAGLFRDDYGIFYIPIDPAEGWQLQLARQLKRAGIEVDLNRLC